MVKTLSKKTYRLINKNENLRQLVVYLVIGGFSALSDLIILFLFVDFLHIFYLVAASISFTVVSAIAFYLHKNYTFKHKGSDTKLRYLIFLVIAGSGLLWNLFFLYLFVSKLGFHYLIAAIIVKFIVLIWNFLMNKFVTFRKLTGGQQWVDTYV